MIFQFRPPLHRGFPLAMFDYRRVEKTCCAMCIEHLPSTTPRRPLASGWHVAISLRPIICLVSSPKKTIFFLIWVIIVSYNTLISARICARGTQICPFYQFLLDAQLDLKTTTFQMCARLREIALDCGKLRSLCG